MQGSNFDLAPQDWATLRGLLDTALELPAAERDGWVEQLDARFVELKPRLRALLAHAGSPVVESLLNTLPKVETDQFAPPLKDGADGELASPTRIGPYRLLRQIGDGGMACVWLAERTDVLQSRQVALKLPHGAWRRAGLAERMAREREILATLEHPNIARLYDAGLADDGQPYLALEYVEGERIDTYCRTHALDVRQRLGLFLQVTKAVAHAHASLVVHRDLKPSNILVTAQGEVRLLDFGIAKLLEHGVAEETELTREVGRALTPDYAAPEQIQGRSVGTGADIYSLGVVLFELLTDQRPYQLKRDSRAALEDAILQVEPMRPSEAVVKGRARRELRGDLDTIVLRALKKVPDDRYATVNALAEDIERYLTQRPVLAQPDSRWYRVRKFVVRNQLPVGVGVFIALAILSTAAIAVWQARVAVHEQQRAERVKSFITSILVDTDPYTAQQGQATTAVELLHRARTRLQDELTDQPEVRVELLQVLGTSFAGLFALGDAESVLAQAIQETKALAGRPKPDVGLAALEVELGQVKKLQAKPQEASALVEEALSRLITAQQRQSDVYVDARILQAGLALYRGDYAALNDAAEDAIHISGQLHGEVNAKAAAGYVLMSKIRSTTDAERNKVLTASQRAYEMMRQIHARSGKPHPRVIEAQHDYGNALMFMGDYRQAEQHIARAHADARAVFGRSHVMVGHFGVRLGYIHMLQGRLETGVQEVREALDLLSTIDPSRGIASAVNQRTLALGFLWMHKPALAIEPLQASLAILDKLKDRRAPVVFKADYAMALIESGRMREADELLPALDTAGAALQPPERPLRAMARLDLLRGQPLSAKTVLLQALEVAERDPRKPYRADIVIDLGRAQFDLGEFEAASMRAKDALTELERTTVEITPNHAAAWSLLGRSLLQRGLKADALPPLKRADDLWQSLRINDRWAGETAYWLAETYRALGRESDAARLAARASFAPIIRKPTPRKASLP
jgi:serine/threonine-protein kinase